MLQKKIYIYILYILLIQIVLAQKVATGTNPDDVIVNHPTADSLNANIVDPDKNPNKLAQDHCDTEPIEPPNANSPTILEPIAASLTNPGVADDVIRSARGTMIGGFGNPMLPTDGFIGSPVSTGPLIDGLTSRADALLIGPPVGDPSFNRFRGSPMMGNFPQPIREFITPAPVPEAVRVPINPGNPGGMLTGTIDNPYNAPIEMNTAVLPMASTAIPGNAMHAMSITNGPITNPLLGDANGIGVPNNFVNPFSMGPIPNYLPNPGVISTGMPSQVPTSTSPFFNSPSPQEIPPNPAMFPGGDLSISKSILASVTGIDPANLGTNARFRVKSSSPLPPSGLIIQAENLLMEGKVAVSGKLPFLGTVNVDGILQNSGTGTVMFQSGNGNIGIMNEVPSPTTMGAFAPNYGINTAFPNALNNVANRFDFRGNVF